MSKEEKDVSAHDGAEIDKTISEFKLKGGTHITMLAPALPPQRGKIMIASTYELPISLKSFLITAPVQNGVYYPLAVGDRVVVQFVVDSAFYETDAAVRERLSNGQKQFLRMSSESMTRRNQRRSDFRVDLLLESFVMPPTRPDPTQISMSAPRHFALIRNLSGGGAAMYSNVETEAGQYLHLNMPDEVIKFGRVIASQVHWVRKPEHDAKFQHYIGVRFIHDNMSDKEELIKYVFEKQFQQLRQKK